MSLVADIALTWRAPRRGVRRQLDAAQGEVRAIVLVMLGCLMLFVSQWPVHARAAYYQPDIPLGGRLAGAGVALLMLMPLVLYAIAGFSRLVMGLFGASGSFFGARLALFWALLCASPLWLLYGLTAGFLGDGAAVPLTGGLALAAFFIFWIAGIVESQFAGRANAHV